MNDNIGLRAACICALMLAACAARAAAIPAPPSIDAASYLVMDYQSGTMPIQHGIDERVEPASLTKVMAVYVIANEIKAGHVAMDDTVTVSEKAWRMGGSKMFIEVDKQVRVEDLLNGIIIQSGNDASVALAEHVAGSEEVFAAMMNDHAGRLGMAGTHFTNSTGWPDANHYTTARDLALLGAALIRDFPEIYSLHSVREFTFNGIKQSNRNELLWSDPSIDGIKTGHTESAGYCLVTSAQREGIRVITVVMGTDGPKTRMRATESLLNFFYRFYETHKLFNAGDVVATSRVWKGTAEMLQLGMPDDLFVTVPRGSYGRLEASAQLGDTLIAPIEKGSIRGNVVVRLEGEELYTRPLVALESVPEGGIFTRIRDEIRLLFE